MRKVSQADVDRLMNQTFYSWDTATMLGDVIGFLEFSEANLAWQRRRERQKAKHEDCAGKFSDEDEHLIPQYRDQQVQGVKYHFDVSLSQRVRYAGLVAFVTTLEWCARSLRQRLVSQHPEAQNGENQHVHLLSFLNSQSSSGFGDHLTDLKRLVHVRNCIVHAAGFVEGYKHEKELREEVKLLEGFSIWSENFLGTNLCIQRGAIEKYAESAKEWVPRLDERCTKVGLLRA